MNESRIENVQRRLSDTEKAQLGEEMARLHGEVAQFEDEKKSAVKTFQGYIERRVKDIAVIARKLQKGYEEEQVACEVYFNEPTPGMKVSWDPATATIVKREPMSATDRQTYLFDPRELPPELYDQLREEKGEAGAG